MAADPEEVERRALKRVNLYSELLLLTHSCLKNITPPHPELLNEKSTRRRNSSDLDGLFVRYEFSHPATLTSIQHM